MTHVWRGCPATRTLQQSPPRTPRRRTLRFSGAIPVAIMHPHADAVRVPRAWPGELARPRRAPGGGMGLIGIRGRSPSSGAGFCARRPQNRPSKIAQDRRSSIREGNGSAPGAQIASRAISGEIDPRPCSATAKTPHPTRAIGAHPAGRGDSHAPPAFSTSLHRV